MRAHPYVQALEVRLAPAAGQMAWTDAAGDNLASDPLNWRDILTGATRLPGSGDYVLFGTDVGGSSATCLVNLNLSVDRVVMDSTFGGTLTVLPGDTLAMNNFFTRNRSRVGIAGLALAV